jgi:serine acetyltransferase
MGQPIIYPGVRLGAEVALDPNTLVGYPTGRPIAERALVLGDGAVVRSGTAIYEGSRIGSGLQTGHNVVIREQNLIGDDLQIWSNSVLDYGCRIGHRVKIHSNCYVAQFTVIEDDCFLAPGVSVANDIHPGCAHSTECMRGPVLERGVQIGAGVTLLPYIRVGAYSVIGAGAVVVADVPPDSVVVGNPGRVIRDRRELLCSTGITTVPYPPSGAVG